jgi:hypothetical protein
MIQPILFATEHLVLISNRFNYEVSNTENFPTSRDTLLGISLHSPNTPSWRGA